MMQEIQNILKENPDLADVGMGQTEDAIDNAERDLDLKFPHSFREYLLEWGSLSFGPNEYQGLGSSINSVIATTKRVQEHRGLPSQFVVVCDHDGDEYVCLDTSTWRDNECPVVIWDSKTQSVSRPRSNSFEEFLRTDLLAFL